MTHRLALAALVALAAATPPGASADEGACVACHLQLQPGIVSDWRLSRHASAEVGCQDCHGSRHATAEDFGKVQHPTVATCQRCHELQASQFRAGDHARAWQALTTLPTFHHLQEGKVGDPTGCAACHRIGLLTPDLADSLLKAGSRHGLGSCDACHTRHTFSVKEAREPEACKACHGDLQYEAWSNSKHGTRHAAVRAGQLPAQAAAPTCQTCHLQGGNHAVRAPLGNVALRLPLEDDQAWAADKHALFVALGVLDAAGNNGVRGQAFEEARIAELDRLGFQGDRGQLTQACRQCHATSFIREQLDQRDGLIRQADALVAVSVREVAGLYADGVLRKKGPGPFPDLVAWPTGSAPEKRLGLMFFDHRARLLAHAFHMSPQAVRWMAELQDDAAAVKQLAAELRAARKAKR
ncbi:MAG: cytochrome C [Anaeromyxobacter sp.]|nr:cytochrome C [Anaeromyxobacter sp.]MBL0278056.1 cytochrome C [Anaeromyxobacter sp.]